MKIVAAELFDDVEVDLWGHEYELLEVTLKVEEKLDQLEAALQKKRVAAEEAEKRGEEVEFGSIDMAQMYGDMLDVILKPVPKEGGKTTKAKTVLLGKFKANEIGLARIITLVESIQEAATERGRPTSPQATNG